MMLVGKNILRSGKCDNAKQKYRAGVSQRDHTAEDNCVPCRAARTDEIRGDHGFAMPWCKCVECAERQ